MIWTSVCVTGKLSICHEILLNSIWFSFFHFVYLFLLIYYFVEQRVEQHLKNETLSISPHRGKQWKLSRIAKKPLITRSLITRGFYKNKFSAYSTLMTPVIHLNKCIVCAIYLDIYTARRTMANLDMQYVLSMT